MSSIDSFLSTVIYAEAKNHLEGQPLNCVFNDPTNFRTFQKISFFIHQHFKQLISWYLNSGVCYTSEECQALGGTHSSTCAQGFGVCCFFTGQNITLNLKEQTFWNNKPEINTFLYMSVGCGATVRTNNTYFSSTTTGGVSSPCSLAVCRARDNVCQIRLDFEAVWIFFNFFSG